MAPVTSDALVLRSYKVGETSRILVLLTHDRGKVRAVARGARGPRSRIVSSIEPLSEVRVSLYGRQGADLMTVGSCELMQSTFGAGSRDPEAAMTLAYVAELVDAFAPEGQAEAALYRLARAVPHALEASVPPVWVARYAEAWTLRLHGIFPSLDRCASCGSALQDAELRYDDRAQGFLCPACGRATGPVLSSEARLCLQQMFSRPPSEPRPASAADLEEIESLHRKLITRHIERDLRSYRVMRDVARELHR